MDTLFKIDSIEIFSQVLEDILNNLYLNQNPVCNDITIDSSSITAAKEEIKQIIIDTNLNITDVTKLFSDRHYDNEDNVRAFLSLLEKKKKGLLDLTLLHYICAFGETVNTFDWKLKLVYGTSELKTTVEPLLQIAFYTITVNHKPADRLYEANKEMLMQLIRSLEHVVGENTVYEK